MSVSTTAALITIGWKPARIDHPQDEPGSTNTLENNTPDGHRRVLCGTWGRIRQLKWPTIHCISDLAIRKWNNWPMVTTQEHSKGKGRGKREREKKDKAGKNGGAEGLMNVCLRLSHASFRHWLLWPKPCCIVVWECGSVSLPAFIYWDLPKPAAGYAVWLLTCCDHIRARSLHTLQRHRPQRLHW